MRKWQHIHILASDEQFDEKTKSKPSMPHSNKLDEPNLQLTNFLKWIRWTHAPLPTALFFEQKLNISVVIMVLIQGEYIQRLKAIRTLDYSHADMALRGLNLESMEKSVEPSQAILMSLGPGLK